MQINLGWLIIMWFLWFGITMVGTGSESAVVGLIGATAATGFCMLIGYLTSRSGR